MRHDRLRIGNSPVPTTLARLALSAGASALVLACQPTPSEEPRVASAVAPLAPPPAYPASAYPAQSIPAPPPEAPLSGVPSAPPTGAALYAAAVPASPASDSAVIARAPLLVIRPPTPAPLAPPPVAKPPAPVALPDLPHPSHYPSQPMLPRVPDTEPCGMTWTGSEWVENDCLDPEPTAAQSRSAHVVIPYNAMPPQAIALPSMVDHRVEGTEGPVRHQRGGHCTAFAFTSALDHAYARWTGQPGAFSVMQVWARYHKNSEVEAASGNVGDDLASEADWPYDSPLASTWKACPKSAPPKPGQVCGAQPDRARLASLDPAMLAEITQIEVIPLGRLDVLREKLAAGMDVTVAIKLHSFHTAGEPGAKYMLGEQNIPYKGGIHEHQVLLAGYAMTPNGTYYLVHNSVGAGWGDAGFAWMHEDVLKAHIAGKVMIVPGVEPKQVSALRLRGDTGLTPKCELGQAPDSLSGQCAGQCPDGSPRHNNVCASAANECASGMVNLTGACEMAAPKSAGRDAASRVAWSCGPGGCTYDIPRNTLGCKTGECAVSCPAPAFRLATMQSGIACVE